VSHISKDISLYILFSVCCVD